MSEQYFLVRKLGLGKEVVNLSLVVTEVSRGGGIRWWRQEVGLQQDAGLYKVPKIMALGPRPFWLSAWLTHTNTPLLTWSLKPLWASVGLMGTVTMHVRAFYYVTPRRLV